MWWFHRPDTTEYRWFAAPAVCKLYVCVRVCVCALCVCIYIYMCVCVCVCVCVCLRKCNYFLRNQVYDTLKETPLTSGPQTTIHNYRKQIRAILAGKYFESQKLKFIYYFF